MRPDPQDHSQEFSEDQNVEGGLCSSLKESKGGNFLVTIRPALWALHGRNWVRVHLPFPRPQSDSHFSSWAGPGSLGTRTLRYASKTVWMLSDNKVASNSFHGSRFELLHEDGIWHMNARQSKKTEPHAGRGVQQAQQDGGRWYTYQSPHVRHHLPNEAISGASFGGR